MPQVIKYESTTIDPAQSAAELAQLVQRFGATRFELRWNERMELDAIRFALRVEGVGEVPVRITARAERVLAILAKAHPAWPKEKLRGQALRVAWRHLKDLTEQLLLAVELGLKDVGAAFMDGVEVWDEETEETVVFADWLSRRAHLSAGERGLRLLRSSASDA